MSAQEERPKRSDQLPEEAPESVVVDDVPGEASPSSQEEAGEQGQGGRAADGDAERLDGTP